MYLRLVRFTLSQEGRPKASAMATDLIPAIKQQPGCISATFFGGGDDGESGLCVLWDSQEHADAAAAVISPRLQQHLVGNVSGQPEMRLFPVIAS
jgi:quinol monooxygenase YgiN